MKLIVSELKNNQLYVNDKKIIHRRLNKDLEAFINGRWVKVRITKEMLYNAVFMCYNRNLEKRRK